MSRTILGLALALALTTAAVAHNGKVEVMPAFPDPTAFTLDGEELDWGWYDTETFGDTPEQMWSSLGEHSGQGTNPNPEDFSAVVFYAWSPPPDNAFYAFARAQDDTLRSLEEKGDWWNDDCMHYIMDWDHSSHATSNDFDLMNRITLHPVGSANEDGLMAPYSEEEGDFSWGGVRPHSYADAVILPAGSSNGQANVEYTFELRHTPWAVYDFSGPDASVVHVMEAEQVVHFTYRFDDGDRDDHGEQDLWSPDGNSYECDRNGEMCADFILVPTDMVDPYNAWDADGAGGGTATAVESSTWARIKEHMNN